MMLKTRLTYAVLVFMGSLVSCNNDDDTAPTTFKTQPATEITSESAVLNGKFILGDT
jgi:hypothetical protein